MLCPKCQRHFRFALDVKHTKIANIIIGFPCPHCQTIVKAVNLNKVLYRFSIYFVVGVLAVIIMANLVYETFGERSIWVTITWFVAFIFYAIMFMNFFDNNIELEIKKAEPRRRPTYDDLKESSKPDGDYPEFN